jgi:hypothetical protein
VNVSSSPPPWTEYTVVCVQALASFLSSVSFPPAPIPPPLAHNLQRGVRVPGRQHIPVRGAVPPWKVQPERGNCLQPVPCRYLWGRGRPAQQRLLGQLQRGVRVRPWVHIPQRDGMPLWFVLPGWLRVVHPVSCGHVRGHLRTALARMLRALPSRPVRVCPRYRLQRMHWELQVRALLVDRGLACGVSRDRELIPSLRTSARFISLICLFSARPHTPPPSHTTCSAGYACPAGSTSPLATTCPAGTYSLSGAPECSACPGGRYGGTSALTTPSCTGPCNAGYACPDNSTSPFAVQCPLGKYSLEGATVCSACEAGRFGSQPGLATSACSGLCPPGVFGATTGLTSASCSGNCRAGWVSSVDD